MQLTEGDYAETSKDFYPYAKGVIVDVLNEDSVVLRNYESDIEELEFMSLFKSDLHRIKSLT